MKKLSPREAIADFLVDHRLTGSRRWLVIGVSGGPDSVSLLHALVGLRSELRLRLHAAHLDHMLRGRQSAADAQFVLDLCHQLRVPVTIEQRDVRDYRKLHRLSLEEAAREVRYSFFADVAESLGTDRLLLGHTLDDHVETVLLHIIRGAGIGGLRGLQDVGRWRSPGRLLTIYRPLLAVSRAETAAYCTLHSLQPRLDRTNLSVHFLRNRVRLELLPLLESYNPGIRQALVRLARTAADEVGYIEAVAARVWQRAAHRSKGSVTLDRQAFLKLAPALQRSVLRRAVQETVGTLKDIEAAHIEDMMQAAGGPAGKRLSLPYSLVFKVDYASLALAKRDDIVPSLPELQGEYAIAAPGVTNIPGWRIETSLLDRGTGVFAGLPLMAELDADRVGSGLVVRARRSGDTFQPLGLGAQKKVSRFLLDARVPQRERDRVPLLCSADGRVLWVVGHRIDERAKLTPETQKVLKVEFGHQPNAGRSVLHAAGGHSWEGFPRYVNP